MNSGDLARIFRTTLFVCLCFLVVVVAAPAADHPEGHSADHLADHPEGGDKSTVHKTGDKSTPGDKAKVADKDAPVLELSEAVYKFGKISQGEVVTHDFKIFNRGKSDLKIEQVKPG